MRISRRAVLACLPAALPASASAFRPEAPAAAVAAAYGAGCPGAAGHAATLDGTMPPPETWARCRFCGCAVIGAADHGEQPAEPAARPEPAPPAVPAR
jgi:hypothetical protein